MRFLVKFTLLLMLLFPACRITDEKKDDTSKNIKISKIVEKPKDTIKEKSAIGKTYDQWLNEIEEFKNYYSSGGWTIEEFDTITFKNDNFMLYTLDIFEKNEKEGTSIFVGIKYIVLVNGKTVLDYIDVETVSRIEDRILYGEGVQFNGNVDIELFAFAPFNEEEEEIITEVYKVYRANKETGMIFEIPTEGVTIIAEYM